MKANRLHIQFYYVMEEEPEPEAEAQPPKDKGSSTDTYKRPPIRTRHRQYPVPEGMRDLDTIDALFDEAAAIVEQRLTPKEAEDDQIREAENDQIHTQNKRQARTVAKRRAARS